MKTKQDNHQLDKNDNKKQSHRRRLSGIVVSDKMEKTVVVAVVTLKKHPKYRKRYKSVKRYKAHDEKNECKIGDKVIIEETRPLSRDKKWKVIKINH